MLCFKFFRTHLGVCRGVGMNREALYVSHIGEDGEELEIVDELPGLFLPALDLEGED